MCYTLTLLSKEVGDDGIVVSSNLGNRIEVKVVVIVVLVRYLF